MRILFNLYLNYTEIDCELVQIMKELYPRMIYVHLRIQSPPPPRPSKFWSNMLFLSSTYHNA